MGETTVATILKAVKQLSPCEQEELRAALDALRSPRSPSAVEEEVERRLFEAGLLSEIKPPLTEIAPDPNRTLIHVKGKPLSEVIVEERR